MPFTFTAELSSTPAITTGPYAPLSFAIAYSEESAIPPPAWGAILNEPNSPSDFGSLSIEVESTGTEVGAASGAPWWLCAYGTATATMPGIAGDPSSEGTTITATIDWVTLTDENAPDGGDAGDDGGDGNPCTATLSGAVSGTTSCTVSAAYISAGSSISTVSITIDPNDAGVESSGATVLIDGPLAAGQAYSGTSAGVAGSVASVGDDAVAGGDGGSETWLESSSDAGSKGAFSLSFTTLGVPMSTFTGISYIGPHGTYTGTLLPSGSAAGDVMVTVNF
jgi:hypothetical protein